MSIRQIGLALPWLIGGTGLLGAGLAGGGKREPNEVRMASTIGPIDAGIVGALEDAYLRKTGVRVTHIGAGTGAALELAKTGGFDLVMVHARALEDRFVADGYGIDRRDIMYNDFVIVGPPSDPAGVRGERSAAVAVAKIAAARALCVTRGDTSGTHVKEQGLWSASGVAPSDAWYVVWEKGATGNAATTRYAEERQAYLLIDRATYLTVRKDIRLQVLVEGGRDLLNFIAVIRVNPARFPHVSATLAKAFVEWLVSDDAQQLIQRFGVDRYGEPLFFPNSDEWRAKHGAR